MWLPPIRGKQEKAYLGDTRELPILKGKGKRKRKGPLPDLAKLWFGYHQTKQNKKYGERIGIEIDPHTFLERERLGPRERSTNAGCPWG